MSKRSLNLHRAVSNHHSNQNLVGWWLGLPGMVGGPLYRDITQYKNHAIITPYTPPGITSSPANIVDGTNTRFGIIEADGVNGTGYGYTHGAEVQVLNIPAVPQNKGLTISAYIRTTTYIDAQFLTVDDSGGNLTAYNSNGNGFGLRYAKIQNQLNGVACVNAPCSSPGKYHYLFTQDASLNRYQYTNGLLYATGGSPPSYLKYPNLINRVWFCRNTYQGGSEGTYAGDLVGDVRISGRSTSAAEAAFLYQQRLKGYPDLLAYRSWVSFAKKAGGTAYTLAVDQGSVSLSGQAVNLLAARTLPVAQGSVTLTAEPANLLAGRTLPVAQGSISLSGQSVNLVAARTLPVAQGSVALTDQSVNLLAARTLTVDQGSVALTGQAVTLTYSGSGSKTLTVDQGTISLSAQAVNLVANRTLAVTQGSVALTGQTVNLVAARTLTVDQGSVALTGQAVTLTYSGSGAKILTVDQGTISLSGQAVNLVYSGGAKVLAVDQDTITLSAQSANLLASRKIAVDQGAITLTAYNVNLTYSGAPVSRAVIAIRCLNGNRWVRAARTPGG